MLTGSPRPTIAWAALGSGSAEVEARFKADERTYKGGKPQLQLRQIFLAKPG